MRKTWIAAAVAAGIITSTGAMAASMEGTGSITPFIGGYTFDGTQHLRTRPVYGLRLGYGITDALGIEGLFDYTRTKSTRADVGANAYRYGGDFLYHFFTDGKAVPFVAAGFGATSVDINDETHTRPAFDYGAGIKYFLSDRFQLRGDVRHIIVMNDTNHNLEYTIGLSYLFGGKKAAPQPVAAPVPAPAPAPAPQPVAKAEPKPGDADGDGVTDDRDACPGTPKEAKVDSRGCPLDSDKDGIPDFLDQCPQSPPGATVDKTGCTPDGDADGDGVPDSKDSCPGTPAGVKVDEKGCPLDSDKDGVFDYLDKCPGTPSGIKVDENGCPLDTDGDGVPDYRDKCPTTPKGVPVDEDGCSIEKLSIKLNILFDTAKADIKPEFDPEIAKAGEFLQKYPNTKAVIEGHTDNVGRADANQKLSQKRAENVRKYIIDKFGIDGSRLTAKGYGSTKPISDNKTEDGRKKNRRIEATFDVVIKR